MSTLKVTNIQDTAGANSATTAQIYSGIAKAWVNFDGTGTVSANQTIRGSFNVSSVFKNATGDYTLNLTNALVDTNFTICATGWSYTSAGASQGCIGIEFNTAAGSLARTTTSARVIYTTLTGVVANVFSGSVALFR